MIFRTLRMVDMTARQSRKFVLIVLVLPRKFLCFLVSAKRLFVKAPPSPDHTVITKQVRESAPHSYYRRRIPRLKMLLSGYFELLPCNTSHLNTSRREFYFISTKVGAKNCWLWCASICRLTRLQPTYEKTFLQQLEAVRICANSRIL